MLSVASAWTSSTSCRALLHERLCRFEKQWVGVKRSQQLFLLIVVLVLATVASWYFLSHRGGGAPSSLTIYYTKLDGAESAWSISMRPQLPGESTVEHAHNAVLYAAVQSVAGPPSDVQAVRFPPGTHVVSANVSNSIATVDLSNEVTNQVGGTFGENGEFKSLVYTLTGLPGIDAVQITIGGRKVNALPGGHLELDQPLRRSDW
jgi:sporulation and spore germination protein